MGSFELTWRHRDVTFWRRQSRRRSSFLAPAPVLADSAIEGLSSANKSFRDGDPGEGARADQRGVLQEKLDNDTTAKALLLRGEIYEKLGKPALAYADYNNAIWLGGLSTTERNRANEGSQRTQSALGVAGGGGGATATPPRPPIAPRTLRRRPRQVRPTAFSADFLAATPPNKPPLRHRSQRHPPKRPSRQKLPRRPRRRSPSPRQSAAGHPQGRNCPATHPDRGYAPDHPGNGRRQVVLLPVRRLQDQAKALTEAKRLADKLRDSLGGRPVLVIKTEPRRQTGRVPDRHRSPRQQVGSGAALRVPQVEGRELHGLRALTLDAACSFLAQRLLFRQRRSEYSWPCASVAGAQLHHQIPHTALFVTDFPRLIPTTYVTAARERSCAFILAITPQTAHGPAP